MARADHGAADFRRLTTPRSAAVAGILFALLFGGSLVLQRRALPPAAVQSPDLLLENATSFRLGVTLMPFAGIAFLWFIGVLRDRLGDYEDRFFATVFLGSGLMFLAMVFAASAIAGGLLAYVAAEGSAEADSDVVRFGRIVMLQLSGVYALRMAGVFMISLATIWLRTGVAPRWLAGITYVVAVMLLTATDFGQWVTLLFPCWALGVSAFLVVRHPARLT